MSERKSIKKKTTKTTKNASKKPAKQEIAKVEEPIAVVEEKLAPLDNQTVEVVDEAPIVEVGQNELSPADESSLIIDAKVTELSEYDHKKIDNDIKYKGPLSYRHLRLIGWVCFAIMGITIALGIAAKVAGIFKDGGLPPSTLEAIDTATGILSLFTALPLPLFLIANFAIILQGKGKYKKLLKQYGIITLAIYVAFIIVYYHYFVVLVMRIADMSFLEARESSINLLTAFGSESGLVVNVFVDLFMCVLIMFFIDYEPKKYFQGKKIILFRLLVLLPIIYEVMSAIGMGFLNLNKMSTEFTFSLPPEILPLLGKKPIGMIIGFVVVCLINKHREKHYLKKGGTPEGYRLYEETNRHSFQFSKSMALVFLVVAVIDLALYTTLLVLSLSEAGVDPSQTDLLLDALADVAEGFTIGKSACLLLVIPFVLLFSYKKTHKNPGLDRYVPFIGIGIVLFAVIETIFFGTLFI